MSNIKLILLSALLLTAGCTPKKHHPQQKLDIKKNTLDSIGQHMIEGDNVLGFSVSIDSAGITIYNGNFGYLDSDKAKAVDKASRFDIASISKMIGVTVIMKLVEENKLNLDQSLEELLPGFPNKEQARKVKLRHLISHTSGLWDNTLEVDSFFVATGNNPLSEDFFRLYPDRDLLFEPGSNYQYNNLGFVLMAFIAENATNKTWQELIDECINNPTGLDFQLIKYAVDLPGTSSMFNFQDGNFEKIPTWVYVKGDGGLTVSSEMLSKFPRLLLNGNIITTSSFDEMVIPKSLNDGTKTGYGFGVRNGFFMNERIIGHTGGWQSTYAIMAHFTDRNLTFAGLMNTDNGPEDIYSIFSQFMAAYLNRPAPDYSSSIKQHKDPHQLLGKYHGFGDEFDNLGTTVDIKMDQSGNLNYCIDDSCHLLYYMGSNRFWLEQYPFDYIEFQIDENVSAIREYYYGFYQVLRKKIQ